MQLQFLHYRSVGCLVWLVCHDLDGECESMWVNVWVRSGWRITSTSDESVECLGCCQQSSQGGSGPEALERRSRHFEISNREEQDLKQNDSRPIMTYPHPPIPCETLCFFSSDILQHRKLFDSRKTSLMRSGDLRISEQTSRAFKLKGSDNRVFATLLIWGRWLQETVLKIRTRSSSRNASVLKELSLLAFQLCACIYIYMYIL